MAIISSKQPADDGGQPPKKQQKTPPKQPASPKQPSNLAQPNISTPSGSANSEILQADSTNAEEKVQEESLRPSSIAEYIGQKDLKGVLDIAIQAAKVRNESLDHLLLYGPPGLGKTTMSLILASEMGVNCKITAAPALERPRDIVGILMGLQPGDILFIDEIHRLPRMTEEILYPAMEDFRLDITLGKGATAKIRSIPLPKFTLVGATTKVGSLTAPLRDRFGLVQKLRFYEVDELTLIVQRTADILNTSITLEGATEIARRSRGTPRIANRLLKRVRDYAQVKQHDQIDGAIASAAMEIYNVDPLGLDWVDRLLLTTMAEQFNGGPVGLEALAASTGEDRHTIEEVYEPYLLQIGYIHRTPRGRVVTAAARKHLGLKGGNDSVEQLSLLED
jgi:holliday junction DNA helicase RuvB